MKDLAEISDDANSGIKMKSKESLFKTRCHSLLWMPLSEYALICKYIKKPAPKISWVIMKPLKGFSDSMYAENDRISHKPARK